MKNNTIIFILLIFVSQTVFSQAIELSPRVISSAGNYTEGGNIQLSWTLGEVAVTTIQNGETSLSQGFHQAYIPEVGFHLDPIDWKIMAYPNPTENVIHIQFELPETKTFFVDIQDVTGRILSQKEYKQVFSGEVIPIKLSSYNSGIYFFRISTAEREQVRYISVRKL